MLKARERSAEVALRPMSGLCDLVSKLHAGCYCLIAVHALWSGMAPASSMAPAKCQGCRPAKCMRRVRLPLRTAAACFWEH